MTETIERVRVLNGHTSPDTAYQVDDYPYSFHLRCKIRYWVETATKGSKKGQQRFMSQTTDARRGNTTWNKPKGSTYDLLTVIYLDGQDHVQHDGVSELGITPERDALWRLNGIYEQLADQQLRRYDALRGLARRRYAEPWEKFERMVTDVADHLGNTGEIPELVNGTWTTPQGQLRYLGAENLPIYLALAREHLAND
ncbi:hypothetical protein [Actinoplanes sp. NPDC051411]|uniref:hypothetical protein n=1 Tax=Actinoplanes sp. NPDC051411 TaxID=3155522 RepID=UPI00342940B3